ncbi:HTH-type transcriptional regulator GntR [Ralstonia psammae]|uniref:HTH-type transcriptional regulator GntR n=1 Tax=Ralstonia psammae TaxID=3058598 RepID=A0ABM9JC59_9RALS|nr:LacI family DNA-binding transcriptional regulator [Ralstonia sp. LMG 19083]CAJ0789421.1 HTH-type transcriptional regulator GntR [Ralstonia sp. LMG 19083]
MVRKLKSRSPDARASGAPSVTLIDVARVAGVAPMTVSRALHRPELVREETQKKVLAAVRATGYVPNMLAGGLASSRSRLVAVLLPTIASSIFAETVQALMDGLSVANYQTLIGLTGYSASREEALVEALLGRRPDAIVLAGTDHTNTTIDRLTRTGIPVVEIWDLTEKPIDMVIGFSHEQVGREVARHLLQKGYHRFGVISVNDPRGLRRCESFRAELARHGISECPFETLPAPATLEGGRRGLSHMLEYTTPDIIVCSSDTLAEGVLMEAASRGIQVPTDLAVMGFGDLSMAAQLHPALSTVKVGGADIGKRTAEALLERFETAPPAGPRCIDTGFAIIDRESA